VTAMSWSGQTRTEAGLGSRALAAILLLLLVIGSFCLWLGVPASVLWGLAKVTQDPTHHLVLGLLAVPIAMTLFGLLLAVLNTCFLRVSGVQLSGREEESEWRPRLRGPLERIMGISAVICLVAFLIWVVFGGGVAPPGAGAW
jgi:hypothetical protein